MEQLGWNNWNNFGHLGVHGRMGVRYSRFLESVPFDIVALHCSEHECANAFLFIKERADEIWRPVLHGVNQIRYVEPDQIRNHGCLGKHAP